MEDRRSLVDVAARRKEATLVIRGGRVINVYSGEILDADIAVYGSRIAYVGKGDILTGEGTETLDASGYYLAPGYIEPHGHLWIGANPVEWARELVRHGATTAVTDSISFFLQQGREGFTRMVRDLSRDPFHFRWSLRVMAQTPTTGEEVLFGDMGEMWRLPEVAGIAEITRWPKIFQAAPDVLAEMARCRQAGKVVEVHTAGAGYDKLNAIAAGGADGDHEAIDIPQALDRLRLGLWTMLRHSSLRRDLPAWVSLLQAGGPYWDRLMVTTDGSSPMFVAEKGYTDHILTLLVQKGVDPIKALRLATLNPATFYRMDHEVGGIAPGRRADILFLKDLRDFRPSKVVLAGRLQVDGGRLVGDWPAYDWSRWGMNSPFRPGDWAEDPLLYGRPSQTKGPQGFPVMNLVSTVITRPLWLDLPEKDGAVDVSRAEGVHHITLLHREGRWAVQGLLKGFARKVDGYACSYNTNGDILVIGKDPKAMARAAGRLLELGGALVLAEGEAILHEVPLPLAGVMSDKPFSHVVGDLGRMERLLVERGYAYDDFLYTSLFLTSDHLPDWRLTEFGLLDIKGGKYIE